MKLAKMYTGKPGFIATLKGFHGKSLGALSLLSKAVYRQPAMPSWNISPMWTLVMPIRSKKP